jgi:uncharacterized protein YjbI with pentapeptide repeats
MDDDIGSEFLLLARTNAVLSAFAVCTLLSISDGTLLYGKSTATLPVVAVSLSVSVIGLVFPGIMLGACLVARMLVPRLMKQVKESPTKQAGESTSGIIAFALESQLNAALAYSVVFGVPILASLYCLWRIAIVPGFQTAACLLATGALMLLLSLAVEIGWFFRKPMKRWVLAGFAVVGVALAAIQLTLKSPVGRSLAGPATIEMQGADLQGVSARYDKRLPGANLSNAQLRGADLEGADLHDAHMLGAVLDNMRADGTIFSGADLRHAYAEMGSFAGAKLIGAKARGADFSNSVMTGVDASKLDAIGGDFQGIDALGADFSGATLNSAHFWGANLKNAKFVGADLSGASFAGAALEKADFSGATLQNVHFLHASLVGAKFAGDDLGGAVFEGAVLTCARLQGAKLVNTKGLTQTGIATAQGDSNTTLPAGLVRPATWMDAAASNSACKPINPNVVVQN